MLVPEYNYFLVILNLRRIVLMAPQSYPKHSNQARVEYNRFDPVSSTWGGCMFQFWAWSHFDETQSFVKMTFQFHCAGTGLYPPWGILSIVSYPTWPCMYEEGLLRARTSIRGCRLQYPGIQQDVTATQLGVPVFIVTDQPLKTGSRSVDKWWN